MKDVSILIVEDDHTQLDSLSEGLRKEFNNIVLDSIDTESDFISNFPKLIKHPPDLIIMDVMIRWASEKSKIKETPKIVKEEGMYSAGFRCLKLMKTNPGTSTIPVIIHSTYDKDEIRESALELSKNWIVIQKSSNREILYLSIRSLLPNSLVLSGEKSTSDKIIDTVVSSPESWPL